MRHTRIELARIAYQFQTPQYLAGNRWRIGSGPGRHDHRYAADHGTVTEWISQLLGVGTAGVGLAGAAGALVAVSGGVGNYGQMANAAVLALVPGA